MKAMAGEAIQLIEQQDWLEPVEDSVQNALNSTYEAAGTAGKKVQSALNGTWLGHPLHPVLTDLPIGAWTTAAVLDVMDSDGADAAIGVGLAGAVGAAVTGLTDWKDMNGKDRRAGLVHGLLNTVALGLYVGSLFARRNGSRTAGKVLSTVGLGVVAASSWIGGELVYRYRDGVGRALEVAPPEDWTYVMRTSDLEENKMHRVERNGSAVLLLKRGEQIYAIGDTCSHRGGPLSEGKLDGDCVSCPRHGSVFNVLDGSVMEGPATQPQPRYDTRVRAGRIEIKIAA